MQVETRDGEPFEGMLARFKTGVIRAGILKDFKRHSVYTPPSEKRRRKEKEAVRRRLKAQRRSQGRLQRTR